MDTFMNIVIESNKNANPRNHGKLKGLFKRGRNTRQSKRGRGSRKTNSAGRYEELSETGSIDSEQDFSDEEDS